MKLTFDLQNLKKSYTSSPQKIRELSENWVLRQIYCPNCGGMLTKYPNNQRVADFFCPPCTEDFELKSKKGKFANKVPAGEYAAMMGRMSSEQKPNFYFLSYLADVFSVNHFFIVPKHFILSEMIEKRKPLKDTARRAGWVGTNIIFSRIPAFGKIFYIKNSQVIPKKEVLSQYRQTVFLQKIKKTESRGWILDLMNCIDQLHQKNFSLHDIYQFESHLAKLHPKNKNIKAKIRQQLQFLRAEGYLDFVDNRGNYQLKSFWR